MCCVCTLWQICTATLHLRFSMQGLFTVCTCCPTFLCTSMVESYSQSRSDMPMDMVCSCMNHGSSLLPIIFSDNWFPSLISRKRACASHAILEVFGFAACSISQHSEKVFCCLCLEAVLRIVFFLRWSDPIVAVHFICHLKYCKSTPMLVDIPVVALAQLQNDSVSLLLLTASYPAENKIYSLMLFDCRHRGQCHCSWSGIFAPAASRHDVCHSSG